jgi:hypothetical protein
MRQQRAAAQAQRQCGASARSKRGAEAATRPLDHIIHDRDPRPTIGSPYVHQVEYRISPSPYLHTQKHQRINAPFIDIARLLNTVSAPKAVSNGRNVISSSHTISISSHLSSVHTVHINSISPLTDHTLSCRHFFTGPKMSQRRFTAAFFIVVAITREQFYTLKQPKLLLRATRIYAG